MKRLSFYLLALTMLVFSSTTAHAKTYINGIDGNYPPFSFITVDGTPTGFDVEAMTWIANKMDFTVEHRPINWDGIIPALKAEKIDMICSGMSMSPERIEQVNFSEPYYAITKNIAVKEGSNITVDELFAGKYTLGVQRGTNEHSLLEKRIKAENLDIELRLYDSPPMSIQDLLNGRIDAIAIDSAPMEDAIRYGKAIKPVGTYAEGDTFGVAVRKTDTELLKMINEGYVHLKADPFWKELHAKYLEIK